jgi:hypothetical protein
MSEIFLTTGDTSPGPRIQLLDRDKNGVNLTGATVTMQVEGRPGVSYPVTIETELTGIVRVPRAGLDVPSGRKWSWRVEFQATFLNGDIQTFPEDGYGLVWVKAQLDDR